MSLLDFPQEIINQLTEFLSLDDKMSCSLVSKSWERIFYESTFSEIFIIYKDTLRSIVDCSQNNDPAYHETRHLVRYLHIDGGFGVTDEELYILQKTFQNLNYLYLKSSLEKENFGLTADWNLWSLLKELYICFDNSMITDAEDELIKIIPCLPLLRRLEVVNRYMEPIRLSLTLNDFEIIHAHLKHLGHFKLSSNLMALSDADVERISELSPATKMGSFSVVSRATDHRWLCYFARKYPNLHTLDFYTSNRPIGTEEQMDTAIELFHDIPLPFQHLRNLNIKYTNSLGQECLFFWDMIKPHKIPLKNVLICIIVPFANLPDHNSDELPRLITKNYLAEFSKTIESLSLQCNKRQMIPIDLIEINNSLNNLVELNINALTTSLELDTLFETAIHLKSIYLISAHITVKNELYNSKRFVLQSFKTKDSKITSDVLRFLSFHCRSLKALSLIETVVSGNFSTPGCQFIDMTYTCLKTLSIQDTNFIINDSKKCPENWDITLITRPVDDIPPKQDYDPNVLPIAIGVPIKAHYHWFFKDHRFLMNSISKPRGSRIEKFMSNYDENKKILTERPLCPQRKKPRVDWKNNCIFGYTKIKIGYVADCTIETF